MKLVLLLLYFYMMLGFSQNIFAQSEYKIQRIDGTVILDGISDENVWQSITPLPVIMQEPDFGRQPSEKTEIRIAYDDDYLYVSAQCYDSEPDRIKMPSKKRDEMGLGNDWFGIVLDTFNDNENALAFFTTPAGLRLDMNVFNDAQGEFPLNSSWNTFWNVATHSDDAGWYVEMRIPFSSLRFQDENGHVVMGLITWRWIARKYEVVLFPEIPGDWGFWSKFKPSQAQKVEFEGLYNKHPLYIVPYVLGGISERFELNSSETEYKKYENPQSEIGLDLKYGVTSNLTLDLTLNPDFAQVEADNQQINLTRFSLFFPEKRLFFQERSSNFEFNFGQNNRVFYSRKIGIYEDKRVPIYGGARLVGRNGPWDIGFLSMQTSSIDAVKSENSGVLRLRRQILNPNTYVGGIITNKYANANSYNTVFGLDGIFRLYHNNYLKAMWAQSFESNQSNDPFLFNSTRININWERRSLKGFAYNLDYSRAGQDYNPGLGFEQRENFNRLFGKILYGWIPGEKSQLLRHQVYLIGDQIRRNIDQSVESSEMSANWEFTSKPGYSGYLAFKWLYEDVTDTFSISDNNDIFPGRYSFNELYMYFGTPFSNLIVINTYLNYGAFYNGKRFSIEIAPTWNVSSSLVLNGFYQYNFITFPDQSADFNSHLSRFRLLYMYSVKWSVSTFIQLNTTADIITTNFRLRYNPREGNDFYLVYDENFNTRRNREIPVLPVTKNRALLIKYSYTFNI